MSNEAGSVNKTLQGKEHHMVSLVNCTEHLKKISANIFQIVPKIEKRNYRFIL